MNHSIRNIYTFRKKQKSFNKTFAAKYIKQLLTNTQTLSTPIPYLRIEEEINEHTKIEESLNIKQSIDDSSLHSSHIIQINHNIKKRANLDCDNYRLIYRLNSKSCVIPCRVSLRKFKMNKQDLKFMEDFDDLKSQLQFKQPNEIDFLTPFNEFYQKINEIVLNQL
ncbi:unnamed protein product [Paramecium pentaurelia]|uniref:Uncharacterized protein n=1 Tax=Paramecium pentaurelia TaxID=43138 RepID=A0A8S1UYG2_9CILI|nr:unnamed protein product [Paramecium pentaurelia]